LDKFESTASQIKSTAGQGAGFFMVLASMINGLALYLMPSITLPLGLKVMLFAFGGLFGWGAAHNVWQRVRGGMVTLILSNDIVSRGAPAALSFTLQKPVKSKSWLLEASIEDSDGEPYRLWSQFYPVVTIRETLLFCELVFPFDDFRGKSKREPLRYRLKLRADDLEWNFEVKTRVATSEEASTNLKDARSLGTNLPYYPPKSTQSWQWRWFKFAIGVGICIIGYQVVSHYDAEARSRESTKVSSA
jgi:hypothetical protein